MIFFFLIFIFAFIKNAKIKKLNADYLCIDNTTVVNGMFVIIVFFSHFLSYNVGYNYFVLDKYFVKIIAKIGQLMVTPFLIYSGFGIYYNIKKNREKYIKNFFKKRFLHLLFNFEIVICIYLLINFLFGFNYPTNKIILSFIGWESIGNSNWYIFVIIILYLTLLFVFKIFKNKTDLFCLIIFTIFSFIYVFILNMYKELYWCNTLLCFAGGMWYCYFKEKIDTFLLNNKFNYIFSIITLTSIFLMLYFVNDNVYIYNIFSIIFAIIISLLLVCFYSKSKLLTFFGKNVFWIYMLQRIPMIIFKGKYNIYLYFSICFFITLVLTYIISKLCNFLWSYINNKFIQKVL